MGRRPTLILLDSNILLRRARTSDPQFATVNSAVGTLHTNGEVPCVVPQNVYEFWSTATRPTAANGHGLSIAECQVHVARIKRLFRFLPGEPALFAEWEALVGTHACHGRISFDARLVAALRTHGITRILTFNGPDFVRFPGLTILNPTAIAALASPPPSTTP
jgi:predicted nucleic acid-binding protein